MIAVKTHITFKDYLNFNIKNSLPRVIIFSSILLVFFGLNLFTAESDTKELLKSVSIWFVLVFVFLVARGYFRLKRAFYSNKKIQEEITYTFSDENIHTKGETFDGDFTWNTIYKVKENKDWFLMYQSKMTMNMIPKKYFAEDQIVELRNLIIKNNVKAKLRKD